MNIPKVDSAGYDCPFCHTPLRMAFEHQVLRRHTGQYWECERCELLSVRPVTWLDEAYSDAISVTDTGIASRNIDVVRVLVTFARLSGLIKKRGLDLGGGHGLLVRMLRDHGLDFRWADKFANNIFARGFEDEGGCYEWLTMVEVFEHLEDPFGFILDHFHQRQARALVFTTQLRKVGPPDFTWYYWSFETGQHITFVTARTLAILAKAGNLQLVSRGTFHLLTKDPRYIRPFELATSRLARYLSPLLRVGKRSLTQTDHDTMRRRLSHQ